MPLPTVTDAMRVTIRVKLQGPGGTDLDEAQYGFSGVRHHVIGNTVDWSTDMQNVADGVRDGWISEVSGHKGFWSAACVWDYVKVDHLDDSNGKVLDQAVSLFDDDHAFAGVGTSSLPWETAVAVSLNGYQRGTFTSHKPRKRGRFYLPPFNASNVTTQEGQLDDATTSAVAADMASFLNVVQGLHMGSDHDAGYDYFDLRVISRGTLAAPLPPTSTQVKWIYVDSKVDSQRRRERQEPALHEAEGTVAHADGP